MTTPTPNLFAQLSDEQATTLDRVWRFGSRLSREITGQKMDSSLADLERIQLIIDSPEISAKSEYELECLGIVLGKVFINDNPGYGWWAVDNYLGEDICLRYKETELITYPRTMILKRIADGEQMRVVNFYNVLKDIMREEVSKLSTE